MNIRYLAAALVASSAYVSAADPHTEAALDPGRISGVRFVIHCNDLRSPDRRAVADLIGLNEAGVILAERARALHIAQRACLRGAAFVAFVRDESTPTQTLAKVSLATVTATGQRTAALSDSPIR